MKSCTFRIARQPAHDRVITLAVVALGFVAFGVMLYFNPGAWHHVWPRLLEYSVAVPVIAWIRHAVVDPSILTVDDRGIRLQSGKMTSFGLAFLTRSWSIDWREITSVAARPEFGIVQIRRKGSAMPVGIQVRQWQMEGAKRPQWTWTSLFRRADVRDTDLWKALEARGLFVPGRHGSGTTSSDFDMAKHPATRRVLWVMGVAFVCAVADLILSSEHWAELDTRYVLPHLAIGGIAGIATLAYLALARVPMRVPLLISATLGVLAQAVAGLASWGALAHVSQAIGGPQQAHPYVRNDLCDALVPLEPGLPAIEFGDGTRQYWCHFPRNQTHEVLLRKGIGDLYLVDVSKYKREIRAFNAR